MSIFTILKAVFTAKGFDRSSYEVTEKHENFEERHYDSCKWVSTKVKAKTFEDACRNSSWGLLQYFGGENERNEKINLTVPIATEVVPGVDPSDENTYTMSFQIPPESRADPPQPTNPEVFINEWPAMNLAAKSFAGYASEDDLVKNRKELHEDIEKTSTKDVFRNDVYYIAVYDLNPLKLFGRVNEVWYVKTEQEKSDIKAQFM